jgi:hypothetical protein
MALADLLIKFDDFVIERVADPFVRWVLRRWGKSCFWLEKQAYAMSFAAYVLWVILFRLDNADKPLLDPWEAVVTALQISFCFILLLKGRSLFRDIDKREARMREGWLNENRILEPYQRLYIMAMAVCMCGFYLSIDPFTAKEVCFMLFFILLSAAAYLSACTPPPPTRESEEVPNGPQLRLSNGL